MNHIIKKSFTEKLIFTAILFLIAQTGFSQKTKKIENKETNEVYYVLESDESVKHGQYKKDNAVYEEGFYKNGKKDGLWISKSYIIATKTHFKDGIKHGDYLSLNRNDTVLSGTYKEGARSGTWKIYSRGNLQQIYNYTTKDLIYDRDLGGSQEGVTNRAPVFIGGQLKWQRFVKKNLNYYKVSDCLGNKTNVKIYIKFNVNLEGDVANVEVLPADKFSSSCKERIIQIMEEKLKGAWVPALSEGKKMIQSLSLPLVVRMN